MATTDGKTYEATSRNALESALATFSVDGESTGRSVGVDVATGVEVALPAARTRPVEVTVMGTASKTASSFGRERFMFGFLWMFWKRVMPEQSSITLSALSKGQSKPANHLVTHAPCQIKDHAAL